MGLWRFRVANSLLDATSSSDIKSRALIAVWSGSFYCGVDPVMVRRYISPLNLYLTAFGVGLKHNIQFNAESQRYATDAESSPSISKVHSAAQRSAQYTCPA
jgi:hypothetical protein